MMKVANQADILAEEKSGWPQDLPASTYDMIRQGAAINPDAPALTFFLKAEAYRDAEVWTYRNLLHQITKAANAFHQLGVGRDDVVSYLLPNLPETHLTLWGGQTAGIVAAFNPLLEAAAVAKLLEAAGTRVLVTLAPFPGVDLWSRLQPILDQVPSLRHLVLVNLVDRVAGPVQEVVRQYQLQETERLCGAGGIRGMVPAGIDVHDFWTLVRAQSGEQLAPGVRVSPDDRSSMFCTGGTTGLPKIAVRHQRNEVANAWSIGRFLGDSITPGKTLFCGLPLFHVNGAMVTGLLPFSKGAHVVMGTPQGYRGDGVISRFWEMVEHFGINFFSAVPTVYAALMQVPLTGHDVGSLEFGICGAAPMPVEVFRGFQERTGLKILEGYGLTEATCVSSVNPPAGERRLGSIGLRMPGQFMKAVVVDDKGEYVRDCGADEVGLLVVSGPNVFEGYLSPEQNAGLWLDCGDGCRWLNTGDLGRQDADGYFWLTGRKKELIIRGGHNIDPAAIEELLHQHPAVQIAAAVGRPDAYAGELPVAYVQLKPGCQASAEELLEFISARIGERAALPKHIRVVQEVPTTAVGKIFKPALRYREIRETLWEALEQAGVTVADMTVDEAPGKGTGVSVTLDRGQDEAMAGVVLGRYSFPFTFVRSE